MSKRSLSNGIVIDMQTSRNPRRNSISGLIFRLINPQRLGRCLFLAVVPGLVCYALLLMILTASGFSFIEAIRDSVQQTNTSSWLGLVSNVGVFVMVSTAVICFFTISLKSTLQSAVPTQKRKKQGECLFLMGLLSTLLAIDDFFLLHDRYVDQKLAYVVYAVCLLALLFRHFERIVKIDGPAFLMAGGLLGLSIVTDVVQAYVPFSYETVQVFEEGFKFVGMATWLYFSYRMASDYLMPASNSRTPEHRLTRLG